MFKNRFGLTTLALATVLAIFAPTLASAHDRDDYRRDHHARYEHGYWGRDHCWHRY